LKRRVLFTEKARNDLNQAYLWYESKGEHLGLEFIERIDEVVEQISNNPMLFAPLMAMSGAFSSNNFLTHCSIVSKMMLS
jgi:plasmid stabilization system protein ParE